MAINGVVETLYKNRNSSTAIFPITKSGAVYTSEGLVIDDVYQRMLISGVNIKTVNNASVLGSGNIEIPGADPTTLLQADIVDNTSSSLTTKVLSANQGRVLNEAINAIPGAMIFKGSLGTSGTISSLPSAAAEHLGFTYQVITAGTYAGKAAKVGDLFVCNDSPEWILLPTTSASGTVLNIATGAGLTGGPITTTGTIELATTGVTAGEATKVTVDKYGRVLSRDALTSSDLPNINASKITSGSIPDTRISSAAIWNNKLDGNAAIAADTKPKVSYDSKGLVTAGYDLDESDLPNIHLSKVSDVTATAGELNKLDGATITTTELNYLSGVTSGIQAQLNGKLNAVKGPAAGTYTKVAVSEYGIVTAASNLTEVDIPSLHIDKLSDITASATEINYTDGVTSNIQTQLNSKLSAVSVDKGLKIDTSNVLIHSNDPATKGAVSTEGVIVAPGAVLDTSTGNYIFKYDEQGHIYYEPVKKERYGTINLSTSWTGAAAPYVQTVATPANMYITADDHPVLDVVVSGPTAATTELKAWAKVYKAITDAGSIIFYASEIPSTALTVQIKN